jgi:hypothetical protein
MNPSKTLLLTLTAVTALGALSTAKAEDPVKARPVVLLNAVKDKNGLTAADPKTNMESVENTPWIKPADAKPFTIQAVGAPADFSTWTQYSFTFVPKADGYVWLVLAGQYKGAGMATDPKVDFDDVSYTGTSAAVNGDFEKIGATGTVDGWKFGKAVLPVGAEAANSGKTFVTVDANNSAGQSVKVTAGQPVTVTFSARSHKD